MNSNTRLGLGIITYNSRRHIDRCLESVFRAMEAEPGVDLVVVDNASLDGTAAYLAERWPGAPFRLIARPDNVGYAGGVNTIARNVGGDYLGILNPDLELRPETLQRACAYLDATPEVGLVGGNLLNPRGTSELVYGALPSPFKLWFAYSGLRRLLANPAWDLGRGLAPGTDQPFEVGYPCGAMWFLRRSAWEEVGPFDERFFLYFEETDWATRCHQTHWKVMVHPDIVAMHEGGGSSGNDEAAQIVVHERFFRSAFQYLAKHYGVRAARSTFRSLDATLRIKAGVLRFGKLARIGASQHPIRTGLMANREFVMGSELSADGKPVVRPVSPAELPVPT